MSSDSSAQPSELELKTEGDIKLLWARKIEATSCSNPIPALVQPFDSHYFITRGNIEKINPKDGSLLWMSSDNIGFMDLDIYPIRPEVVGVDEGAVYAIVDGLYNHNKFLFYKINRINGGIEQVHDVSSLVNKARSSPIKIDGLVAQDGKLYVTFYQNPVVISNGSVTFLPAEEEQTLTERVQSVRYNYFDAGNNILRWPLVIGDASFLIRGTSGDEFGKLPRGVYEVSLNNNQRAEGLVDMTSPICTITRKSSSIFVCSDNKVYHLKFPSN